MRVLLVDDDPSVLRFLEDLLQARGHEVLGILPRAGDEPRCRVLAAEFRPDVLIVDKQMPVDPALVAAVVREVSCAARVILCTGSSTSDEERRRIGVDDVLAKPFAPSDLDRALARAAGAAAQEGA